MACCVAVSPETGIGEAVFWALRTVLSNINQMKILVTGAKGFVGRILCGVCSRRAQIQARVSKYL